MKKVVYSFPALVICLIYAFIFIVLDGTFDAVIDAVNSVVLAYIALPVIGSVLLMRNHWWGSVSGATMGVLLIYNNLQYTGHQHVNIDFPLGVFVVIYYAVMGVVCYKSQKKSK